VTPSPTDSTCIGVCEAIGVYFYYKAHYSPALVAENDGKQALHKSSSWARKFDRDRSDLGILSTAGILVRVADTWQIS